MKTLFHHPDEIAGVIRTNDSEAGPFEETQGLHLSGYLNGVILLRAEADMPVRKFTATITESTKRS